MYWLLDVHFGEGICRIEDETAQQILNVVRKMALNCVKSIKSKFPLSEIMFGCLLDCEELIPILMYGEN
jgi:hypothetical protein